MVLGLSYVANSRDSATPVILAAADRQTQKTRLQVPVAGSFDAGLSSREVYATNEDP
jgi:hypothetical protein